MSNRRLAGEAEAYQFRSGEGEKWDDIPSEIALSMAYKDYQFTYTSTDVYVFNQFYKKFEGYYPFDETTQTTEFSGLDDLNSNELKTAWNYASRAYDNVNSVFSVLVEKDNTQVVVDTVDDTIYISFRGTSTISDVYTDTSNKVVLASQMGWLGIFADEDDVMLHSGFNDYVNAVYDDLLENHILGREDKKLVIVGHSLGGQAAQIFAYRLYLDLKFRNIDMQIDKVIAFGAPKGIYSPFNMVDNYLNIFNVAYEKDPVPYVYPLYGNALGTQIIFKEDNTYRLFYRDQLTPYLAINLGNSNQYFHELKRNGNYRNSYFTDLTKSNVYDSLFKYPDGKYTLAIAGATGVSGMSKIMNNIEFHKAYSGLMDTLEPNNLILERNLEIEDNNIREVQAPVNHPSYNIKLFENMDETVEPTETFRKNNSPPKILGFVSNFSPLMKNQIIIF